MKIIILSVALVLSVPLSANADVITLGTWSRVAEAGVHQDGRTFWDGASWDGTSMGVGSLIGADRDSSMEFLHNGAGDSVAFQFDDPTIAPSTLHHITAWQQGALSFGNGVFSYDSGTGRRSDSLGTYWQYALFRIVQPDRTRYFMGVEDILRSEAANDWDYNDLVVTFDVPAKPVPEPPLLILVTVGVVLFLWRRL